MSQLKSKKKEKPAAPAIRLGRNSSARNVLKASEHNALHEQENAAGMTPGVAWSKGLPNQHALLLLQQLSKAVDEPFRPVGLCFYDKVNSVKVDNASKLLKEMSWREFFSGKTIEEVRKVKDDGMKERTRRAMYSSSGTSYRSHTASPAHSTRRKKYLNSNMNTMDTEFESGVLSSQRSHNTTHRAHSGISAQLTRYDKMHILHDGDVESDTSARASTGYDDFEAIRLKETYGNSRYGDPSVDAAASAQQQQRGVQRVTNICAQLCNRIELLWKELKMSPADRDFYRQTLLKVNPRQSVDLTSK